MGGKEKQGSSQAARGLPEAGEGQAVSSLKREFLSQLCLGSFSSKKTAESTTHTLWPIPHPEHVPAAVSHRHAQTIPKMTPHRHTTRPVLHACSRVCCTSRPTNTMRERRTHNLGTQTHTHIKTHSPQCAATLSDRKNQPHAPDTDTAPDTGLGDLPPTHPCNPKRSKIRPPLGSECHTPWKKQSKAHCLLRQAGRQLPPPQPGIVDIQSPKDTQHTQSVDTQVTSDVHGQAGRTSSTKRWTHISPVRPLLLETVG